ncbi:Hypothetical predicted protein [Mytilus galloprovincialis]|uniref:Chitin-binding type-4 domain-containing protein n=1 Tax=Mytilus galloprovincialis TaxID=29158 RepID=A0A8B6ELW3_MYTGA|nr:Hypothetical predicted protein [Mytilus galloprovincialis]
MNSGLFGFLSKGLHESSLDLKKDRNFHDDLDERRNFLKSTKKNGLLSTDSKNEGSSHMQIVNRFQGNTVPLEKTPSLNTNIKNNNGLNIFQEVKKQTMHLRRIYDDDDNVILKQNNFINDIRINDRTKSTLEAPSNKNRQRIPIKFPVMLRKGRGRLKKDKLSLLLTNQRRRLTDSKNRLELIKSMRRAAKILHEHFLRRKVSNVAKRRPENIRQFSKSLQQNNFPLVVDRSRLYLHRKRFPYLFVFLEESNGKCGVCGDPYVGPRKHEAGGIYASGIIAAKYPANTKTVTVTVLLTVNHLGYFEFRLCPHNDPTVPVTQRCLDKHLLSIEEGSIKHRNMRFYPKEELGPTYNLSLEIPFGMICTQCVLQWRYHTENSWGMNPNGTSCKGCGLQEEFYNCADLSIGGDEHGSFNKYKSLHTTEPTLEQNSMDIQNRILKQNTTELKVEKLNIRYLERNQSSKNHMRNYTDQLSEPARNLMKKIKDILLSFGNDMHGQSLVLKSLGQIALSQNTKISSSNPGNTVMSPINHVLAEDNVKAARNHENTVISPINHVLSENTVISSSNPESTVMSPINHVLSENTEMVESNLENTVISAGKAENTAMSPTNQALSENTAISSSKPKNTVISANYPKNTIRSSINHAVSENTVISANNPKITVISSNIHELSENGIKSSRNHLPVPTVIVSNNSNGNTDRRLVSKQQDQSISSDRNKLSPSVRSRVDIMDRETMTAHSKFNAEISKINRNRSNKHTISINGQTDTLRGRVPVNVGLNKHSTTSLSFSHSTKPSIPSTLAISRTSDHSKYTVTSPTTPSKSRLTVTKVRPTISLISRTRSAPRERMASLPVSKHTQTLLSSPGAMPKLNSSSHLTASSLIRAGAKLISSLAIPKPKHIASSSTRVEEITPKLQSHNIQTFMPLTKNVIQSRTFVVKKGTGNKNKGKKAPVRRKFIIVRRVSKGGRLPKEIQELLNSSQYMIRRRKVSVPKNLIRNLKSQDLMKQLQKQLPDLKNVHEFINK